VLERIRVAGIPMDADIFQEVLEVNL
jgi:hypothetical protein